MKDMATQSYTVSLSPYIARRIEQLAAETQSSAEAIIPQLVEEGLRLRRHPGIEFRDTAFGRRPYVIGSRLGVWDVVLIWRSQQEDHEATLRYLDHFAGWQLDAALDYYREFQAEVEEYIREANMTPEEVLTRFPFLRDCAERIRQQGDASPTLKRLATDPAFMVPPRGSQGFPQSNPVMVKVWRRPNS
jgi:uncharacterized protein (DUF433 family)